MSKKLLGNVAIVTGASKGIGASVALHLAEEGLSVVVNYSSDKEGAEKIVSQIVSNGGKAVAVKANMSQKEEIEKLFFEANKAYGRLDVLVNNAGIYEFAPLESITKEAFYKIFDINVLGVLLACEESLKYFGSDGGSIVNISSVASTSAIPTSSVYSASKAAIDSITRTLAAELGPRKIRVNAVNPGMIDTEGTRTGGFLESELRTKVELETPLVRTGQSKIGQPNDVARVVVFFASDASEWITGQTLLVAGGHR